MTGQAVVPDLVGLPTDHYQDPVHGCTIVAKNYLAHAAVLARSFLGQHPSGTFTILVIDSTNSGARTEDFGARLIGIDDIGIERTEVRRMAAIYHVLEFATAVKPWLLRTLLGEGRKHVLYFDPDIEIFDSVNQLAAEAEASGIVLTPHALKPMGKEERTAERAVAIS